MATPDPHPSQGSANGLDVPGSGTTRPQTPPAPERTSPSTSVGIGHVHEETTGEKLGRFFRRAMDRLGGNEPEWRREDTGRPASSQRGNWAPVTPSLRISRWSDEERSGSPDPYRRPDDAGRRGAREDAPVRATGQHSRSIGRPHESSSRPPAELSGSGRYRDQSSQSWSEKDQALAAERDAWASWGERGAGLGTDWREPVPGVTDRSWQREPLAARDVMTRNPRSVARGGTLRDAAAVMREENCGVVPIVDAAGRLQGILTDRDIVIRGVTDDLRTSKVEDVMTDEVSAVTEDEPLTSVLDLMGRRQIRRVPVVDRSDRLLGIISMADIATRADYDEDLQDAFLRISARRSFWSLFT